jgi:hypothetical protein
MSSEFISQGVGKVVAAAKTGQQAEQRQATQSTGMSTEKLESIQKRLDEKQINPKTLSEKQRTALNRAFRDGVLKGYKNVGEMDAERRTTSIELAKQAEEKLAPLTPKSALSLGVYRGGLVAAGDIIGSFFPYIKDSKLLAYEARNAAIAGSKVSYIPKIRQQSGQAAFNAFSKLIDISPLRGVKIFKRTGALLDNLVSGTKSVATGNLLTSQALRTELKSQVLGATGASAGSVTYDLANFPARFVASAGEDLSELSENDLDKMNPIQRTATMAVKSFREALLWNAAAFGLTGTAFGLGRFVRDRVGLAPGTSDYDEVTKIIRGGGLNSPYEAGTAAMGLPNVFSGMGQIGGVLPGMSGEMGKAARKVIGTGAQGLTSATQRYAPLYNTGMLVASAKTQANQVYKLNDQAIENLYRKVDEDYDLVSNLFTKYDSILPAGKKFPVAADGSTNIPLFSVKNIEKYAKAIKQAEAKSGNPEQLKAILAEVGVDSPVLNNKITKHADETLTRLDFYNKPIQDGGLGQNGYITPAQLMTMRVSFTDAYGTALKGGARDRMRNAQFIKGFSEAYEKDLLELTDHNGMLLRKPIVEGGKIIGLTPGNQRLTDYYNHVKNNLGQKAADDFYKDFTFLNQSARTKHENANLAYSSFMNMYSARPVQYSNLAKIQQALGPEVATQKALLGGFGGQVVNDAKAFKQLSDAMIDTNYPTVTGVEQMAKYMGVIPDQTILRNAGIKPVEIEKLKQDGEFLMAALLRRKTNNALLQNVEISKTGGVAKERPFITETNESSLADVNNFLLKASPSYKANYEENAKFIQSSMGQTGRTVNYADMDVVAVTVSPRFLKEYEKELASNLNVLGKHIPKNLEQIRRRAYFGEGIDEALRRPATRADLETEMTLKEAFATPGFITRKLTPDQIKFLDDAFVGERKLIQEALQSRVQYNQTTADISKFERFDFGNFEKQLGLAEPGGRNQLKAMFKYSGIKNPDQHMENLDVFVNQLRRAYESPKGNMSTFAARALTIGIGVGGLAGASMVGLPGGIFGALLAFGALKYGGRAIMSPEALKYFNTVYPEMELRQMANGVRGLSPSEIPLGPARYADFFNYIFLGDPDAPIVTPDNIKDEKIIEYLLKSPVKEIEGDSLYNFQNEKLKDAMDPDRRILKGLNPKDKNDVENVVRGLTIGKERDLLLEDLDSPTGAAQIQANQPLQAFLSQPSAVQIPEGVQQAAANIPAQTQAVYDTLFPQDKLGSAIAGTQNG